MVQFSFALFRYQTICMLSISTSLLEKSSTLVLSTLHGERTAESATIEVHMILCYRSWLESTVQEAMPM